MSTNSQAMLQRVIVGGYDLTELLCNPFKDLTPMDRFLAENSPREENLITRLMSIVPQPESGDKKLNGRRQGSVATEHTSVSVANAIASSATSSTGTTQANS